MFHLHVCAASSSSSYAGDTASRTCAVRREAQWMIVHVCIHTLAPPPLTKHARFPPALW